MVVWLSKKYTTLVQALSFLALKGYRETGHDSFLDYSPVRGSYEGYFLIF